MHGIIQAVKPIEKKHVKINERSAPYSSHAIICKEHTFYTLLSIYHHATQSLKASGASRWTNLLSQHS